MLTSSNNPSSIICATYMMKFLLKIILIFKVLIANPKDLFDK